MSPSDSPVQHGTQLRRGLTGLSLGTAQTHDSEYLQLGEHHRVAGVTTMNVSRLMRRVFSTSLPLSVIPALECFLVVTSVRFAAQYSDGHGVGYLGGTAVATAWMLITLAVANALVFGVFDVILEAHTNNQFFKVASTVQSALALSVICAIVMVPAWAACEPLMLVIGQNEANSQAAHEFLQFALAGILQLLSYRVLSQYLRARHAVVPLFCINLTVVIMHYFVCEMFVQGIGAWEGLGFAGVPLALAVAWTLQLVFVGAYLLLSGLAGDLWIGCSVLAFRPSDMGAVIRAGKSLGWMEMLELLVYFAPTLVAGQLPIGSVAAQGIVSTVYLNLWLLFQGSGLAAHKLVRESVRDGAGQEARNVVRIATVQSTCLAFIAAAALYAFSGYLPSFFTKDAHGVVAPLCSGAFQVAAFCLFCDIAGFTARGVLRGIERKGRGGAVYVTASFVVGVPLYVVFAFALHDGVQGFWEARVALMMVVLVIVVGMLLNTSWRAEAGRAQVHNFAPVPTSESRGSVGSGFVKL